MTIRLTRHRAVPSVLACLLIFAIGAVFAPDAMAQRKKEEPPKKKSAKWHEAATPLHIAAFDNDLPALKKLLTAKDVNVNATMNYRSFPGFTPLHMAAYEGHAKAIAMLVAKEADLNIKEKGKQRTALHIAASYGRIDAVRALIKAGADVSIKDKLGNTAQDLATDKAVIAELKKAADSAAAK